MSLFHLERNKYCSTFTKDIESSLIHPMNNVFVCKQMHIWYLILGEMIYTLFMSPMAPDKLLFKVFSLLHPPPPVVVFLVKYSLTYQIVFKIKSSWQIKLNQLKFALEKCSLWKLSVTRIRYFYKGNVQNIDVWRLKSGEHHLKIHVI